MVNYHSRLSVFLSRLFDTSYLTQQGEAAQPLKLEMLDTRSVRMNYESNGVAADADWRLARLLWILSFSDYAF